MRVIGIDPGSRITGYGVVDASGGEARYVTYGSIRLGSGPIEERLKQIFEDLSLVIEQTRPDVMAVEKVFMARNAQAALTLGQARGGAICAGVVNGLPMAEYTAKQIKQAAVGYGGADKQQVQHMVRALLRLPDSPTADAADALACAICHVHVATLNQKLAAMQ